MKEMYITSGAIEERILFSNKIDDSYMLEKANELRDILCNILESPDSSDRYSLENCLTPEVLEEFKIEGDEVVEVEIDGMPMEFKEYLENNLYFKFNDGTEDGIITTFSSNIPPKTIKRYYLLHSDLVSFSFMGLTGYWLFDENWIGESTKRIREERKNNYEKLLKTSFTIEELYKRACDHGIEKFPLVLDCYNIGMKIPITENILHTDYSPNHVCIGVKTDE